MIVCCFKHSHAMIFWFRLKMALVPRSPFLVPCVSAPLRERRRHWSAVAALIGLRSRRRALGKHVLLLPDEATAILRLPAISTVTFYDGEPCEAMLRDMTKRLISANPWLAARLTRKTGAVTLRMPENDGENDEKKRHFQSLWQDLSIRTPLKMRRSLEPFMVKPGFLCLDEEEELFKALEEVLNAF